MSISSTEAVQKAKEACRALMMMDGKKALAFIEAGADPNEPNLRGMTLVAHTAYAGRSNLLDKLIKARGDIEARCDKHYTPLMHTGTKASYACAELLLQAGAKPDQTNDQGETALMVAVREFVTQGNKDALKGFSVLGAMQFEAMLSVLNEDADWEGDLIKYIGVLTEHGADPTLTDAKGNNVLAFCGQYPKVSQALEAAIEKWPEKQAELAQKKSDHERAQLKKAGGGVTRPVSAITRSNIKPRF